MIREKYFEYPYVKDNNVECVFWINFNNEKMSDKYVFPVNIFYADIYDTR